MHLFDRNQTDFPTCLHRAIWNEGLLLMPPALSLADLHDERRSAFTDLYAYCADVYADMYDDPGAYGIDCAGVEEAMRGRSWRKAFIAAGHNRQQARMKKLLEKIRISFPQYFCDALLRCADENGVVGLADYQRYFLTSIARNRYKTDEMGFLQMLARGGVQVQKTEHTVRFANQRYPGLFRALDDWRTLMAPYRKGSKKYRYDSAFHHLDYRIFLPDYKITYESSQWYMSDEVIRFLDRITQVLGKWGLRLKKADNTHSIALGCDYKGMHLVWFGVIETYPLFRIRSFRPGSAEMRKFEAAVDALPNAPQMREFWLKHIHRCTKCGCHPVPPRDLGCWIEVFGRRVNVCGGHCTFETGCLNDAYFEIAKTFLEIHLRILSGSDE